MLWQNKEIVPDVRDVINSKQMRYKMEKSLEKYLKDTFELQEVDLRTYSPLTLAYIGDGVYDLIIRTILVSRGNSQANKLHKKASGIVKAATQAEMIMYLMEHEHLTEEEQSIFKRGRNAFTPTKAKNASVSEYRKATGFEALMGYLYLKQDMQRMIDLIKTGLEGVGINL